MAFAHEGPFGKFDQIQLQRGLQVYTEVCAACHGLKFVPIRTLSDEGGPGMPEDQVRAYAKQFTVTDKDTGEDREGLPTDNFPANVPTAGAPDLSLMAKGACRLPVVPMGRASTSLFKRHGRAGIHRHAILVGYTGEEKDRVRLDLLREPRLPGRLDQVWPPPLSDDAR